MTIRVRDARSAEFKDLWRIDQRCFAPGVAYSQGELAYYMAQRGAFTLVAEEDASPHIQTTSEDVTNSPTGICGFLVGQRRARGLGHVITIDVVPEARRSGVGSLLMKAAEERLRDAGCGSVYLETAVDNAAALTFYKRRGYYVVKIIPRYYMNKVDALLMGKKLE